MSTVAYRPIPQLATPLVSVQINGLENRSNLHNRPLWESFKSETLFEKVPVRPLAVAAAGVAGRYGQAHHDVSPSLFDASVRCCR